MPFATLSFERDSLKHLLSIFSYTSCIWSKPSIAPHLKHPLAVQVFLLLTPLSVTLPTLSSSYQNRNVLLTAFPNFCHRVSDDSITATLPIATLNALRLLRVFYAHKYGCQRNAVVVVAIADSKNIVAERHCNSTATF